MCITRCNICGKWVFPWQHLGSGNHPRCVHNEALSGLLDRMMQHPENETFEEMTTRYDKWHKDYQSFLEIFKKISI